MLSRVADSLYWMSRYFERADNASRVLKATYSLILNPAKFSTEERWFRAVSSLAPGSASQNVDPQRALFSLVADPEGTFSIVKCISGARENARQVREEISSEMWEHLNTLFHDVTGFELKPDDDADAFCFHSAEERLLVERTYPVAEKPQIVLGLGVGESAGAGRPGGDILGLGDRPYIVSVGRVDEHKGSKMLASYFATYKERHPGPLALALVGPISVELDPHQIG